MSNNSSTPTSMYNWGTKGWLIALYAFALYFSSSVHIPTVTVASEALANIYHWDYSAIMLMHTIGGLISIPVTMLFAEIVKKRGMRWPTVLWMCLFGLSMFICGSKVWAIYAIGILAMNTFSNGCTMISPASLVSKWFPTKKGIVLGVVTMGLPLTTVLVTPLFSSIANTKGFSAAYYVLGAIIIVVGLLTILVRNTPQEMGCYPDNDPSFKSISIEEEISRSPKEYFKQPIFWKLAFGYGLPWMAMTIYMMIAINVMLERGMELPAAIGTMSGAAFVGIIGSFIIGFLDQKFGTKPASIINGAGLAISLILVTIGGVSAVIAGTYILFFFIGGIPNVLTSMAIQVYGPKEFNSVNRFLSPMVMLLRNLPGAIIAILVPLSGNHTSSVAAAAVIAVIGMIIMILLPKSQH